MTERSAFDRKRIEETAVSQTTGLLEHLNIPPDAAAYIRRNKKTIWIIVACIALVITAVSLYGSYKSYRESKASSALTHAMNAAGEEKKSMLAGVVDKYGSTQAGMWGRIELAQIEEEEGNVTQAISSLVGIKDSVSNKNPVTPLLLYNLAVLYEKSEDLNNSLATYNELLAFKGFEALCYKGMGRIYEAQSNKEKALEMYRKYMEISGEDKNLPSADPERSMIQSRINSLES